MKRFTVRYMFLEPQPETLDAETSEDAAALFLERRGGAGAGNWGRCLVVTNTETSERTDWALIRLSPHTGKIVQISEKGEPIQ